MPKNYFCCAQSQTRWNLDIKLHCLTFSEFSRETNRKERRKREIGFKQKLNKQTNRKRKKNNLPPWAEDHRGTQSAGPASHRPPAVAAAAAKTRSK